MSACAQIHPCVLSPNLYVLLTGSKDEKHLHFCRIITALLVRNGPDVLEMGAPLLWEALCSAKLIINSIMSLSADAADKYMHANANWSITFSLGTSTNDSTLLSKSTLWHTGLRDFDELFQRVSCSEHGVNVKTAATLNNCFDCCFPPYGAVWRPMRDQSHVLQWELLDILDIQLTQNE